VGAMKATTAGQNVAQAVQDSFDRGLIGESAGRVQQSSVSIFGAAHNAGTCGAHDARIIKLTHERMRSVSRPAHSLRSRCSAAATHLLAAVGHSQPPAIFPRMPVSIAPPHLKFHLEVFAFS